LLKNTDSTYLQRAIKFVISLILFLIIALSMCFFANGRPDYFEQNRLMIFCALSFAFVAYLWRQSKRFLLVFLFFNFFFVSTAYIKILTGMVLNGIEILDALAMSTIIFCILAIIYAYLQIMRFPVLKKVGLGIFYVLGSIFLLVPLLLWGYYIVSNGHLLAVDIILTLFQTNPGEAAAYLKSQRLFYWIGAIIAVFGMIYFNIKLVRRLPLWSGNKGILIFITLFMVFVSVNMVPKVHECYALNLLRVTKGQLKTYKDYGAAKSIRKERLKKLRGLTINPQAGGIYVLVIGESETRDHMGIYGYIRSTTPWLNKFSHELGTVVFTHAYSCHTHTVPVLSYALSEKNQYNKLNMADAYSIVEVAKAAGYKTYWVSNQLKYGAWDTPVAEMASTVDYQKWMNGNAGETTDTMYYDEKLAQVIPNLNDNKNILLVCHVMGSHGSYADRYPAAFKKYKGLNKVVDEYDNSVLYNDAVLQKIYNTVSANPNFKAIIYLSDHGEDPDLQYGHESTKFTWKMAHIPLIMHVTIGYRERITQLMNNLQLLRNSYWTNDFIYNVLIGMLGIQGLPHIDERMNLGSDKYDMKLQELVTLHGHKKISDDPNR